MLRALIFYAACSAALQLELCAMMLDCILANQPPTQLGASIIAHTHARLCAYRRRTRVQHLVTQFALLLHQQTKLVTTAASWTHFPAAPPTQVLTGSLMAPPRIGAPAAAAAYVRQLVEGPDTAMLLIVVVRYPKNVEVRACPAPPQLWSQFQMCLQG